MQRKLLSFIIALGLCLAAAGVWAANPPPSGVPHTFSAHTPAKAGEVNDNFSALQDQINYLLMALVEQQGRIHNLETTVSNQATTIAGLQSELAAVQGNSVLALDGKLALVTDPVTSQPTARFEGVNVQVVNGQGATDTTNGLGNLIVGYNETVSSARQFCSDGQYDNQTDCESNGYTWSANQRSGSHNLIAGIHNAYSQYGGFVAGRRNVINGEWASVSGGNYNIASASHASVSGGSGNKASGDESSVSGGANNTASGSSSSVSGGMNNTANNRLSSVSGGLGNTASGGWSSVSGGSDRSATGIFSWAAGSLHENQ